MDKKELEGRNILEIINSIQFKGDFGCTLHLGESFTKLSLSKIDKLASQELLNLHEKYEGKLTFDEFFELLSCMDFWYRFASINHMASKIIKYEGKIKN